MVLMSSLFTDCFAAFVRRNKKMNYSRWNGIHCVSTAAASEGPAAFARQPTCKKDFPSKAIRLQKPQSLLGGFYSARKNS